MSEKTVKLIISGKVQGVYYRAWTIETSSNLGLSGWVRNMSDGTVEAVFSGEKAKVDKMIDLCWDGSEAAMVEDIEILPYEEPVKKGFQQRPTI